MADAVLLIVMNLFPIYIGMHYVMMTKHSDSMPGMWEETKKQFGPSEKARRRLVMAAWLFLWIAQNASYGILQVGNDIVRIFCMLFIAFTLVLEILFMTQEENTMKQYQEFNEKLLGNQAEYYERQYRAIAGVQDAMHRQRHEQKNRNLELLGLARQGDCQGIIRLLEEQQKGIENKWTAVSTGNFTVDAVLNYELSLARDNEIAVESEVSVPNELDVNATVLCGILGNALDNAIDACCRLEEKKRKIHLLLKVEKHNLFFEVKNSYDGVVKCRDGRLVTRKEDSRGHGLGIRVMEEMIHRVNGTLETIWDDSCFTLRIVLYHVI